MNKDTDLDLIVKYVIIIGGIIASFTGIITSIYYLNEMKLFSKLFLYLNSEKIINNYFLKIYNIIRDSVMDIEKGENNIFQVLKNIGTVLLNIQNNMATKDDMKKFATKDDMKDMKDDMKKFATKDDMKDYMKDMEKILLNHINNNNRNEQITLDNPNFNTNNRNEQITLDNPNFNTNKIKIKIY